MIGDSRIRRQSDRSACRQPPQSDETPLCLLLVHAEMGHHSTYKISISLFYRHFRFFRSLTVAAAICHFRSLRHSFSITYSIATIFTKPTVLAVHGAWHKAECLSELKSRLEGKGYEVITPQLLSCSNKRIDQLMQTDSKLVRQIATELIASGKEAVVVLHSYGGIVGTNALHGLGVQQRKQEGKEGAFAVWRICRLSCRSRAKVCLARGE